MATATKIQLTADEEYLQAALKDGRARKEDISMKALGTPDTRFQARVIHLNMDHVHRLSRSLEELGALAPIVVFHNRKTGKMHVGDGFHRFDVYRRAKMLSIPAYVIDCDPESWERETMEFATMCNREACLGRTREDIKKAVFMLLADSVWFNRGVSSIASHAGCHTATTVKYRAQFCEERGLSIPETTCTLDGKRRRTRSSKTVGLSVYTDRRNGNPQYRCSINGKNLYLGKDLVVAEKKLGELADEAEKNRSLHTSIIRSPDQFFTYRSLAFKPIRLSKAYMVTGWFGYEKILVTADGRSLDGMVKSVGSIELLRLEFGQHVEGVILIPAMENTTAQMTFYLHQVNINVLTPDELVASLKPGSNTD